MTRRTIDRRSRIGCRLGYRAALLGALTLLGSAGGALANVVVLDPGGISGFRRGDVLEDDKQIKVPFGRRLTVTLQSGGMLKTVEIKGLREGSVVQLLKPEPITTRLLALVREFARSGGKSEKEIAGARGARITIDSVAIGIEAPDGITLCVESGRFPIVSLASGTEKAQVRIQNTNASGAGAAIELAKAERKAWPSAVAIRDSAVYRLSISDGRESTVVDVRLRTVPAGTLSDLSSARSMAALIERDCIMQAGPALRDVFKTREQI